MAETANAAKKAIWFRHVGKVVTLAASSGAALVSIFTALYSYGVIGQSESHQSIGNIGAAWVGLRPAIDTASAIDDTVHFAATVTDKNGSILVGARPTWTTGDSSIATVLTDGSVIAHGPGRTMVSVVVGKLITHSTIVVKQRVASVEVARASGDSVIVLPEGAELQLRARGIDAPGHEIAGVSAAKGVSGVTPATAIGLVAGSNQRALAGKTLAQALVVRATNRKGGPASGKRVIFRLAEGQGSVDPATALTDADGRARAAWTLGSYPGRQTLLASVENVDSALSIQAEADPIAGNTRVAAITDHLTGRAGDQLPDSVAIRVTDSSGRVLPDVPVRWTLVDGGSVQAQSPRTDSLGVASARWTLAGKTGRQRLGAQIGVASGLGIPPVTINAAALAGAAAAIVVTSGDGQHAAAGAELPKSVVLRVVDGNGSAVAGAELTLAPAGGLVTDRAPHTDS